MSVPTDWQSLDVNGKVIVEHVWIGGHGHDIRSKCRTYQRDTLPAPGDLSEWGYDGSSTNQASGEDSEVFIRPRKVVKCPLRGGMNCIALCDTYLPTGEPANTNFRAEAVKIFDLCAEEEPWFAFEQEYIIMDTNPDIPIGFAAAGYAEPQGPYYCSQGSKYSFGRNIMDAHYRACLHANLNITGTNAEVFPGQWEYQMGPCTGIDAGDSMILGRYLLMRVAESFGLGITFEPKPVHGDWNGSGAHTNYSTKSTREPMGRTVMDTYIENLGKRANVHIQCYGEGNMARLTGQHETASWQEFRAGVADRGASIRIPRKCDEDGCGYLEDRRPSSNCDPYVVSALIADTTINQGVNSENLINSYKVWLRQESSTNSSLSRNKSS